MAGGAERLWDEEPPKRVLGAATRDTHVMSAAIADRASPEPLRSSPCRHLTYRLQTPFPLALTCSTMLSISTYMTHQSGCLGQSSRTNTIHRSVLTPQAQAVHRRSPTLCIVGQDIHRYEAPCVASVSLV